MRKYNLKLFFCLALILTIALPGPLNAGNKKHDDLFSVAFANEKQGWACGYWGTILHTADGGKTWLRQESGTDYTLTKIFFVDALYGWAVGDGGTILSTRDGGNNWTPQKNPEPCFLMGVHFVSRQKGWAVGEGTTILSTDDGGKNWQVQFKDENFILKAVSFSDERNGWAVGEYGYIFHTADGGKTWRREAGEFGFSPLTGEIEGGNLLFSIAAIDQNTAWAVGIDGYVTMTVNSGKTWQVVNTGAPRIHLFSVASDGSGSIVIGGKGTLLCSHDRGKTWQAPRVMPSIEYGWLYGIGRRGDAGFAAVGWNGAVYLNDGKNPSVWNRAVY